MTDSPGVPAPAPSSTPADSRTGDWVVTLDIENADGATLTGELAVRGLAVASAGSRTYVAARPGGYSFTAIVGTRGAEAALVRALQMLGGAQGRAGLDEGAVVCAEVTLVGSRAVPAADLTIEGCDNSAS